MDPEKAFKRLLIKSPFYGLFCLSLPKVVTRKVKTLCVSRNGISCQLNINPDFWEKHTDDEQLALIQHELGHICFQHMFLCESFPSQELFNIAADCEVNSYIDNLPAGGATAANLTMLFGESIENGLGTKAYYEYLKKQMEKQQKAQAQNPQMPCNGGHGGSGQQSQQGSSQGGQSSSDSSQKDDQEESPQSSSSPSQAPQPKSQEDDSEDKDNSQGGQSQQDQEQEESKEKEQQPPSPSDQEEDESEDNGSEEDEEEDSQGSGSDDEEDDTDEESGSQPQRERENSEEPDEEPQQYPDGLNEDFKPVDDHSKWKDFQDIPEATQQLISNNINSVLKSTAEQIEKQHGTIPGEFKELIEKLREKKPEVFNWKAYFRRMLGSIYDVNIKSTRRKQSKRFVDAAGIQHKKKVSILVAIDTSGSVSKKELQEFFSEIDYVYKAGARITIIQCDTRINGVEDYDGKNIPEIKGRGGTDFNPPVRYYMDHRKEYASLIYFTDGEAPMPYKKPSGMVWVISSCGAHQDYPGKVIYIPQSNSN